MAFDLIFRIFYTSFYVLLLIVLLGLLIITPADAIHQALQNNQLYNVFVIAGCYFITIVVAILIYASRLYTTRSVLTAIPKTWVPVEKGDVGKSVRRMIVQSLTRSALIAWSAQPRVPHDFPTKEEQSSESKKNLSRRKKKQEDYQPVTLPDHHSVWGVISHEGWSSPTSEIPNLQYTSVILELPHLVEAKAVSLAPVDPSSTTTPPMPDLAAVELLQRPVTLGLRDYITHLTQLGVLPPEEVVVHFINNYEAARFAGSPLSEEAFQNLMKLFADVLRIMLPLNQELLDTESEKSINSEWREARFGTEGRWHELSRKGSQTSSVVKCHFGDGREGYG